jgi:bla regulator protein BlaR1
MIHELTNHLWQSTVFAMLAAALALAFRKNRASVRYWMWFAASAKFFIPFALLLSLGSHLQRTPTPKVAMQLPAPAVSLQISEPFLDVAPALPPARRRADWLGFAIVAVWLCGFGAILLIRLRGWMRIRNTVRSSAPIDVPAAVEVRSAPGLLEPGVVGLFRPVLFLPEGIAERLTPQQLEAVLAHELCHVRRRDNLFSVIHMIVEAAFWFHPLVWWIGARLIEERERACDEEVLRLGSEPQVYAEGILNVCKLYVESPLVCVSGVTGADLKRRVRDILNGSAAHNLSVAKKAALAIAAAVALAAPVVVGVMNAPFIRAQSAPASPLTFEVTSVKPRTVMPKPGEFAGIHVLPGGQTYEARAATLKNMIRLMYKISDVQIVGAPDWINTDRFDVDAKAEKPTTLDNLHIMFQNLMADRFKLQFHRETRTMPAFVLTVDKGGSKMKVNEEPEPFQIPIQFSSGGPPPTPPTFAGKRVDMEYLRWWLGQQLRETQLMDRPVVDQTGLKGFFDFKLTYAPDFSGRTGPNGEPPPSFDGPNLFQALKEQLGLKLESTKGPVEVFIIDHVEKPSEN